MKKNSIARPPETVLPDGFLYTAAVGALTLHAKAKLNLNIVREQFPAKEEQFVAVANHLSVNDWFIVAKALYPRLLNVVITRYFYSSPKLNYWLRRMGTIPKNQFSPDVGTIRCILSAVKKGGNVMLFPEGRTTPAGLFESCERSTVKLLKKLGLPVYCIRLDGGYLARPKWAKLDRKGRIDVRVYRLFTAEQVKEMSEEEIFSGLSDALRTDEYAWEKKNRVPFRLKRDYARGLEGILYKCPRCGSELKMRTEGNRIFCPDCGNGASLDEYYDFTQFDNDCVLPDNIGEWYEYEKKAEAERIENDPDYVCRTPCTLQRPYRVKGEWLTGVGRGEISMTREGFRYTGTQDGEAFELFIPIKQLTAIPFGPDKSIELYFENEFYSFVPDDTMICAKLSIVGEQLHLWSERQETR